MLGLADHFLRFAFAAINLRWRALNSAQIILIGLSYRVKG